MQVIFDRPQTLLDVTRHYCPGCTHGIIHRILAEVIDELGLRERAVGVCPVGCSVFMYNYLELDWQQASHGRAPAVATGIKRVLPDKTVFTYQGDGDLAAIGTAEIVHAAARGEKISVIFVNNAIYGMTGGQLAPTSLLGQRTTTTPQGREPASQGYPVKVAEMLATLEGAGYIARVSVHNPLQVSKAKTAIKQAFQFQQQGYFSLVEVLSSCPTNWGLTPLEALQWLENNMLPYYPLGEFKLPRGVQG